MTTRTRTPKSYTKTSQEERRALVNIITAPHNFAILDLIMRGENARNTTEFDQLVGGNAQGTQEEKNAHYRMIQQLYRLRNAGILASSPSARGNVKYNEHCWYIYAKPEIDAFLQKVIDLFWPDEDEDNENG